MGCQVQRARAGQTLTPDLNPSVYCKLARLFWARILLQPYSSLITELQGLVQSISKAHKSGIVHLKVTKKKHVAAFLLLLLMKIKLYFFPYIKQMRSDGAG